MRQKHLIVVFIKNKFLILQLQNVPKSFDVWMYFVLYFKIRQKTWFDCLFSSLDFEKNLLTKTEIKWSLHSFFSFKCAKICF